MTPFDILRFSHHSFHFAADFVTLSCTKMAIFPTASLKKAPLSGRASLYSTLRGSAPPGFKPLGLSPTSANTFLTSYSQSRLSQCNFLLQLLLVILSVGEDQEQKTASDTIIIIIIIITVFIHAFRRASMRLQDKNIKTQITTFK